MTLSNADLREALDACLPEIARQHHSPGVNAAVARDGQVIWEGAEGLADLERGIPMTPATVNRSGSMGKTYTATAVMQLVEQGIVELDGRADAHLAFRIDNPLGGGEVTVRHLLTHSSGMMTNGACSTFSTPTPLEEHLRQHYAGEIGIDFFPKMDLPMWSAPTGEAAQYSNIGIATLGLIVQRANPDGLPFSEYVQRNVIDLLGMTSTQYPPVQDPDHIRPDLLGRMSTGYSRLGGGVHIPSPRLCFADFPAGTAVLTPGDHVRLLAAYLEGGTLDGRQLLKPETVQEMLTPQREGIFPATAVGLVWMLRGVGTELATFGHSGAHMWGWTNTSTGFLNHRIAIAVSANHWNLFEGEHNPRYGEGDDLTAVLGHLLRADRPISAHRGHAHPWAWKVSYVTGLVAANRFGPYLGIEEPLTDAHLDAMTGGARSVDAGRGGVELWDAEGFRAGVADFSLAEPTGAGIHAFLASDRIGVSPAEMYLVNRELLGPTGGAVVGIPAELTTDKADQ